MYAVEIDTVLADALPGTVAERLPELQDRLTVIDKDALQAAPARLRARCSRRRWSRTCRTTSRCRSCCTLLAELPSIRHGLVMVQKEVADRLVAPPGSKIYGVPSVKLAWYASAQERRQGAAERLLAGTQCGFGSCRRSSAGAAGRRATGGPTFAVIDAAFAQRRKTLRAALAGWAGSAPAAEEILVARRGRARCPGRVAHYGRVRRDSCVRAAVWTRERQHVTEPLNAEEYGRPKLGASGPVRVRVPAKINLHLGVGPIRPDGYHELTTVYHAISLFDEVTARRGDQLTLTMEGEGAGVAARWTTRTSRSGPRRCSPRPPACPRMRACTCASRSRSRAVSRAEAPTRPPRWSPATRCGGPA